MRVEVRVLLADDERLALELITHLMRELGGVTVVGVATNGMDTAAQISALQPDLVLLDIQMPSCSGIAIAESLGEAGSPQIIFVSAFDHYAARAFELDATDYLLKPVGRERLSQALERARRRQTIRSQETDAPSLPSAECLWIPMREGAVRVSIASIDWVEAAGDYVLLHTAPRTYMIRATMAEMTERMSPHGMIRIHRSTLVRPSAVTKVTRADNGGTQLTISDGCSVTVGPSYLKSVLAVLGM